MAKNGKFFGVGIYEKGEYNRSHPSYDVWYGMLKRCYSPNNIYYSDCTVCEDWFNYQNFAKWFNGQNYRLDGWNLDKDLINPGNRHYSPETCCFIPKEINTAMAVKSYKERKVLSPGVTLHTDGRFVARIRRWGKKDYIGLFNTELEASKAYEDEKIKYLCELGIKYSVPEFIQASLQNFKVK